MSAGAQNEYNAVFNYFIYSLFTRHLLGSFLTNLN